MRLQLKILVAALLSLISSVPIHVTAHSQDRVDEISLEMIEGKTPESKPFGAGFKIVFRRDGTALFVGRTGVKLIGSYRGAMAKADFERLAQFLESRRYMQIGEAQPVAARLEMPAGGERVYSTESPLVITAIKKGSNLKRIVRRTYVLPPDNEKTVPKELMEIEKAITDAAMRIAWEKTADK